MGRPAVPIEQSFWSKVQKGDECWLWTGSVNYAGYGQLRSEWRAHRYSWELHNGAVPSGMLVCHRCDNRRCVNPAHLFLGTHKQNMADMTTKSRQAAGVRHGSSKLSAADADLIRLASDTLPGVTQREIAKAFGVRQSTVWRIVRGNLWRAA